MHRIASLLIGSSLLAGCGFGEGIGSWRDAAFGLVAEDEFSALERVLESAEGTPGNQGLLYVAMVEAEAAGQSAGRAVAERASPEEVETALGEVIYALEPDAAPDWEAKRTGLVPGWTGYGYGMIRASEEMAAALRTASGAGGEAGEAASAALICVEHSTALAGRTLELAQSLLAGAPVQEQEALLPQLNRLANALLKGLDADSDGSIELVEDECALQQAHAILEPVHFDQASSASP